MNDLIYRDDVIDMLRNLIRWNVKRDKWENQGLLYDDVMFGVQNIPAVNTEGYKWILCSDRMPEYYQRVFLCYNNGDVEIGMLESYTIYTMNGKEYEDHWTDVAGKHHYAISEVTKWMPIPEP